MRGRSKTTAHFGSQQQQHSTAQHSTEAAMTSIQIYSCSSQARTRRTDPVRFHSTRGAGTERYMYIPVGFEQASPQVALVASARQGCDEDDVADWQATRSDQTTEICSPPAAGRHGSKANSRNN